MSSKLFRRIAAIVVAVLIPFGATASSAHAADWSSAPQASLYAGDGGSGAGVTTNSFWRSSWS